MKLINSESFTSRTNKYSKSAHTLGVTNKDKDQPNPRIDMTQQDALNNIAQPSPTVIHQPITVRDQPTLRVIHVTDLAMTETPT